MKKGEYLINKEKKYIVKLDGKIVKTRYSKRNFEVVVSWFSKSKNKQIYSFTSSNCKPKDWFIHFDGVHRNNKKLWVSTFIDNIANLYINKPLTREKTWTR